MGFSHYFSQQRDVPQATWNLLVKDFRALLRRIPRFVDDVPLILGNWTGDPGTRPTISSAQLSFNGASPLHDPGLDLGHETFRLTRVMRPLRSYELEDGDGAFDCCKTARKPYDLVVCAALILAEHHAFETWHISSDGDIQDWTPALNWITEVLGPGYYFPLGVFDESSDYHVRYRAEAARREKGEVLVTWP